MSAEVQLEQSWITSLITISITLAIVSLILIYLWEQSRHSVKLGNKIPGPTSIPFFGNALLVLGKTNHQLVNKALEFSEYYGNVVRVWLGFKLFVFLTDPNDVEIILNSNTHIEKASEYRFFKPWLGDGLLLSTGDKWRSHRKLIAPAFHVNVLKSFVDVFNEKSLVAVDKLKKEVGKVFDIHDYMSEITVNILLETAMGTKRTSTIKNDDDFVYALAVMQMCDLIHQRHYKIWYRSEFIFKLSGLMRTQSKLLGIIHRVTKYVIKQKNKVYERNLKEGIVPQPSLKEIIAQPETEVPKTKIPETSSTGRLRDDLDYNDENDVGEKRRLAFLDLMVESKFNGEMINDSEIREEVDTIMFEGHDTTAAGSSFALCLLGIHQDIQEKVYQELFQIFGNSKRPATFADTIEMKYLERVILETLRMYPPVPIIARKVNEDVKLATGNYIIPADTTVVIGTFKIHRREDLYPNALIFDPDNFLPERTQNRHYYSFIPFSAGPRSCVGRKYAMLKLKILLSTILRNYRMKSNLTEKDFRLQGDIILKREDGFRLEIEPRINK